MTSVSPVFAQLRVLRISTFSSLYQPASTIFSSLETTLMTLSVFFKFVILKVRPHALGLVVTSFGSEGAFSAASALPHRNRKAKQTSIIAVIRAAAAFFIILFIVFPYFPDCRMVFTPQSFSFFILQLPCRWFFSFRK